jgi:hypothetical protein
MSSAELNLEILDSRFWDGNRMDFVGKRMDENCFFFVGMGWGIFGGNCSGMEDEALLGNLEDFLW